MSGDLGRIMSFREWEGMDVVDKGLEANEGMGQVVSLRVAKYGTVCNGVSEGRYGSK